MTYDLFFFEQTIARPKMLYKLNYKNIYDLPTIQKIKINLSLKETKKGIDYKVIQSMDILELICSQRPFLEKIERIRHQNILLSLVAATLRNFTKLNFF
jgi:ribosomal protein L5